MNVFVLSTGRCGSETFARACRHMTNFTAAHESNSPALHPGVQHPYRPLRFPDQHIEVDNRLSWFLGTLQKEYGSDAYYVHLLRRREEVARSITTRGEESIIFSFASGVLQHYRRAHGFSQADRYQIGLQYWDTVNDNIELFLRDKLRRKTIWLHEVKRPFAEFWGEIGAQGDRDGALAEWDVKHNTRKVVSGGWASLDRQRESFRAEMTGVIPAGTTFILVDDDQTTSPDYLPGRQRIPFLGRHGQFWGPPADSGHAIQELEAARRDGVSYIGFTATAFWWLQHYKEFYSHLKDRHHCQLQNDEVVLFGLRD